MSRDRSGGSGVGWEDRPAWDQAAIVAAWSAFGIGLAMIAIGAATGSRALMWAAVPLFAAQATVGVIVSAARSAGAWGEPDSGLLAHLNDEWRGGRKRGER